MTQSRTKKIFLKRPIYKIPCKKEGCNIILHTRSFNRKRCHKHGANAKNKICQRTKDKIKLALSPYGIKPKKVRECMKCRKLFESLSDSNRICVKCNKENDNIKEAIPFHGWKLSKGEGMLDNTVKYDGPPICFHQRTGWSNEF